MLTNKSIYLCFFLLFFLQGIYSFLFLWVSPTVTFGGLFTAEVGESSPAASHYRMRQLTNVTAFTRELRLISQTMRGLMGRGLTRGNRRFLLFLRDTSREWCPVAIRLLGLFSDTRHKKRPPLLLHSSRFISPASVNSHTGTFIFLLSTFCSAEFNLFHFYKSVFLSCTLITGPHSAYASYSKMRWWKKQCWNL